MTEIDQHIVPYLKTIIQSFKKTNYNPPADGWDSVIQKLQIQLAEDKDYLEKLNNGEIEDEI